METYELQVSKIIQADPELTEYCPIIKTNIRAFYPSPILRQQKLNKAVSEQAPS